MKRVLILVAAVFFAACGGGDDGTSTPDAPEAALLVSPANNSECVDGTPVSTTDSRVLFQWNPAVGADSYFLYVKNLVTQSTLQHNAGSSTSLEVQLNKGTPYSWYVSARSESGDTTPSETWKFYNAGDAIVNYAPFPAELVSPAMSSSIYGPTVTLEWEGSDIEGAIVEYEVYFGTAANPTTLHATVTNTQLDNISVVAGTYYWKVVTIDAAGNSTPSPVFQFIVL